MAHAHYHEKQARDNASGNRMGGPDAPALNTIISDACLASFSLGL